MDEFLSIEDLRWEFGASRAWTYKYLAPHIKSITVNCDTTEKANSYKPKKRIETGEMF